MDWPEQVGHIPNETGHQVSGGVQNCSSTLLCTSILIRENSELYVYIFKVMVNLIFLYRICENRNIGERGMMTILPRILIFLKMTTKVLFISKCLGS